MKKIPVLFILLISVFVISCNTKKAASPVIGGEAPLFKEKTLDGNKISLNDYRGKVVIIEFWATWCPPCKESIPVIEAIQEKYAPRGLSIIGISLDEGPGVEEKVSAFRDAYKIGYPIIIDSDGKISSRYRVSSIPTFFILDKNLKIAKVYRGYTPQMGEHISKDIESLL